MILGSFALALVGALAFLFVENRADEPMVAVSLFRERVFTGGTIAVLMWGFGLFGIYFFTSLYLQNVLGFSPTEAGAAFVPMALLMAVGAIVSEKAASKIGGGQPGRLRDAADGRRHRVGVAARAGTRPTST